MFSCVFSGNSQVKVKAKRIGRFSFLIEGGSRTEKTSVTTGTQRAEEVSAHREYTESTRQRQPLPLHRILHPVFPNII